MSYTPTEWESTDVVTATRMNALETAVGEMNMSYTPNTWSDGDILSAEKMNALEQAVASGGGGGIETATVEFRCSGGMYGVNCCNIVDNALMLSVPKTVIPKKSWVYTVPLLNGVAKLSGDAFSDVDTSVMPTTEGSIELTEEGFVITGDGTITIKGN